MYPTEDVELRTLSAAQPGIWFAQVLAPDSPAFNIAEHIEIFGPVDPARFERALRRAVEGTGALRTRIAVIDGEPRRHSAEDVRLELPVIDVSAAHDPQAASMAWMPHPGGLESRRRQDPNTKKTLTRRKFYDESI